MLSKGGYWAMQETPLTLKIVFQAKDRKNLHTTLHWSGSHLLVRELITTAIRRMDQNKEKQDVNHYCIFIMYAN